MLMFRLVLVPVTPGVMSMSIGALVKGRNRFRTCALIVVSVVFSRVLPVWLVIPLFSAVGWGSGLLDVLVTTASVTLMPVCIYAVWLIMGTGLCVVMLSWAILVMGVLDVVVVVCNLVMSVL